MARWLTGVLLLAWIGSAAEVPKEHPRLFGSREELRELARNKPDVYRRVMGVALEREGGNHEQMVSSALVYAISGDEGIGRQAVELAMKYVDGPIRTGHVRFGDDLALSAIVYDLCWPLWTEAQRRRFHSYMNQTVDANVRSETHVFHNGWYSYKHWGIGLAAYATYHENERAPGILAGLEREFRERVVPAFRLAGDGGGRVFTGERDKALSARRILVNRFRYDPAHQAVHTFNETTPVSGSSANAYKDFLWRDEAVPKGDLHGFKLSHFSPGPGYVYARSSWGEDAVYFFFKCGDRFTAHQHLDLGHFLIYKHEELIGDGGHYYSFATDHEVNYAVRSIAHNTILVKDPRERWPAIRKGNVTSNDGGQAHDWPHHNGAVADASEWEKGRDLYDIGDILAFEDRGSYLYLAGDCTRAYSPKKLKHFTRQIVYLRPGTFVIFDRVISADPRFRKTFVLQAMKPPAKEGGNLVVTNGRGRLFIQPLLPADPTVRTFSGTELYRIDGRDYPPEHDTGAAPESRIEISPPAPSAEDYFLHVLTATDAGVASVPQASAVVGEREVQVTLPGVTIRFTKGAAGGQIDIDGQVMTLAKGIRGASP